MNQKGFGNSKIKETKAIVKYEWQNKGHYKMKGTRGKDHMDGG